MQTDQHIHDGTARRAHSVAITQQLDILREAVRMLSSEGHTIQAAGCGPSKPFVFLAPSARLADIADAGRGAY